MTKPRPNVRKSWKTCPNCCLAYMGTQEGMCPNCLSVCTVSVSPRLAWGLIVTVATLCALAVTGLWWLVTR